MGPVAVTSAPTAPLTTKRSTAASRPGSGDVLAWPRPPVDSSLVFWPCGCDADRSGRCWVHLSVDPNPGATSCSGTATSGRGFSSTLTAWRERHSIRLISRELSVPLLPGVGALCSQALPPGLGLPSGFRARRTPWSGPCVCWPARSVWTVTWPRRPPPRGWCCSPTAAAAAVTAPANRQVASALGRAGFATLLLDLLTLEEEAADRTSGRFRFDVELLA